MIYTERASERERERDGIDARRVLTGAVRFVFVFVFVFAFCSFWYFLLLAAKKGNGATVHLTCLKEKRLL